MIIQVTPHSTGIKHTVCKLVCANSCILWTWHLWNSILFRAELNKTLFLILIINTLQILPSVSKRMTLTVLCVIVKLANTYQKRKLFQSNIQYNWKNNKLLILKGTVTTLAIERLLILENDVFSQSIYTHCELTRFKYNTNTFSLKYTEKNSKKTFQNEKCELIDIWWLLVQSKSFPEWSVNVYFEPNYYLTLKALQNVEAKGKGNTNFLVIRRKWRRPSWLLQFLPALG